MGHIIGMFFAAGVQESSAFHDCMHVLVCQAGKFAKCAWKMHA